MHVARIEIHKSWISLSNIRTSTHFFPALSPAGKYYKTAKSKLKLDKSKAKFVQVFHTDDDGYGYSGEAGHVDIYINGGKTQPGAAVLVGDIEEALMTGSTLLDAWKIFIEWNINIKNTVRDD